MNSYEHHGQQVFEPQESSAEAAELDSLTLDEAKEILLQLGYFAEDTRFLALRLSREEFEIVGNAAALSPETLESFIAKTCCEWADRKVENEKD